MVVMKRRNKWPINNNHIALLRFTGTLILSIAITEKINNDEYYSIAALSKMSKTRSNARFTVNEIQPTVLLQKCTEYGLFIRKALVLHKVKSISIEFGRRMMCVHVTTSATIYARRLCGCRWPDCSCCACNWFDLRAHGVKFQVKSSRASRGLHDCLITCNRAAVVWAKYFPCDVAADLFIYTPSSKWNSPNTIQYLYLLGAFCWVDGMIMSTEISQLFIQQIGTVLGLPLPFPRHPRSGRKNLG